MPIEFWICIVWFCLLSPFGYLAVRFGFKLDLEKFHPDICETNKGSEVATFCVLIMLVFPVTAIAYALIWLGGRIHNGIQFCNILVLKLLNEMVRDS